MINTYNLFISHSWSYEDEYERLVKLLDNHLYFAYKNYSVPKDDPIHTNGNVHILYNAIREQMSHANVVLILAGVYSSYSDWIDKEITIAKTEFYAPKPIIAIEPWGAERTSQKVREAADATVGWDSGSIVDAIRKYSI